MQEKYQKLVQKIMNMDGEIDRKNKTISRIQLDEQETRQSLVLERDKALKVRSNLENKLTTFSKDFEQQRHALMVAQDTCDRLEEEKQ